MEDTCRVRPRMTCPHDYQEWRCVPLRSPKARPHEMAGLGRTIGAGEGEKANVLLGHIQGAMVE